MLSRGRVGPGRTFETLGIQSGRRLPPVDEGLDFWSQEQGRPQGSYQDV